MKGSSFCDETELEAKHVGCISRPIKASKALFNIYVYSSLAFNSLTVTYELTSLFITVGFSWMNEMNHCKHFIKHNALISNIKCLWERQSSYQIHREALFIWKQSTQNVLGAASMKLKTWNSQEIPLCRRHSRCQKAAMLYFIRHINSSPNLKKKWNKRSEERNYSNPINASEAFNLFANQQIFSLMGFLFKFCWCGMWFATFAMLPFSIILSSVKIKVCYWPLKLFVPHFCRKET